MFSIVVIAVAIGVFTMYVRHERQLRHKRLALAREEASPPAPTRPDPR